MKADLDIMPHMIADAGILVSDGPVAIGQNSLSCNDGRGETFIQDQILTTTTTAIFVAAGDRVSTLQLPPLPDESTENMYVRYS
jgi:hypothetical protein